MLKCNIAQWCIDLSETQRRGERESVGSCGLCEESPHGGVKSGTDYAGPHWWVGPLQDWNEKFVFIYIFLLFIFPSNYWEINRLNKSVERLNFDPQN